MYLLFLPSLLAVVVILVITLKDQFGANRYAVSDEEVLQQIDAYMTPTEVQA